MPPQLLHILLMPRSIDYLRPRHFTISCLYIEILISTPAGRHSRFSACDASIRYRESSHASDACRAAPFIEENDMNFIRRIRLPIMILGTL